MPPEPAAIKSSVTASLGVRPIIASLLILIIYPCILHADTPTSQANSGPHADLSALIRDLGSTSYRTREKATNDLMDSGPWAYPAFKEAFDRDQRFEFRRRIKHIVFEIYVTDQIGPPRAFLGISQPTFPRTEDFRIPAGASALRISDVFAGSAADAAGVHRGDLILMLDNQIGRPDFPASQFTSQIGRKKPGDEIHIGILRGGTGFMLREGETPGFRIRDMAGCKKRLVRRTDDNRILPRAAAFVIEDPGAIKCDPPLKSGDLIVAMDDEPVSPTNPDAQFQQWITTRSNPATAAQRQPAQPVPMPVPIARGRGLGTMQVVRGGEWIELTARLGRWPDYLPEWLIYSHNIDAAKAAELQGAFDDWWRANFDPRGSFAERADNDPRWKLTPAGASGN